MRSRKPIPMSSNMVNRPGVVGAAIVPHAPQFLTLPETEDKAQVARVNTAMRAIGDQFRALDPDLLIVLSNAHCDDMVVHCVPPFALHCGRHAEGSGLHEGPLADRRRGRLCAAAAITGSRLRPGLHLGCRARHRLYDPARILWLSARAALPADLC